MTIEPILVSMKTAAEALGRSERHVQRLVEAGKLNPVYEDRSVRIRYAEIKAYAESLPTEPR